MLQRWHNNIIPPKYHFVAEKNSWFDTGVIQVNVMLQARIVYYIYIYIYIERERERERAREREKVI